MKLAAGVLLAGAASRLLPASIPFRFFGAAVAYHLLAWIALSADAQSVPRFAGGLGWPLAALHLVTLGVLAMTAIGASLQLLPVATRQPVLSKRWPAAIWWLYTPGVAAVALGMGIPAPRLLAGGAIAVVAALGGYALLLARNLIGARGMPVVIEHGWAALASLVVVLASALSLAGAYVGLPGLERGMALAWHVSFAAYGFMGLLAFGLSYILVPMFALSAAPDERRARVSLSLAVVALLLSAIAASGVVAQPLGIAAIVTGAGAVALHWRLMHVALKTGMRRQLGRSLTLVRMAWAMLAASLAAALGVVLDAPFDGMAALFGLLLIGGWLLSFLLGILQRIVPFLASMHAGAGRRQPPTPSSLTAERPLSIHFVCHLGGLALLAVAILADSPRIGFAGALLGTAGAVAFATFFAIVVRRMSVAGVDAGRREASAS
ncbi:MAG TPA: hypothetical protein VF014_15095 [Casimicrobiaceae bacterium]|nr:hypothetical protein [Casimicrobiaceae bacterium]